MRKNAGKLSYIEPGSVFLLQDATQVQLRHMLKETISRSVWPYALKEDSSTWVCSSSSSGNKTVKVLLKKVTKYKELKRKYLKDVHGTHRHDDVRAFHSIESIFSFLRELSCFDELLLIEKEKENFVEAASIAK